MMPPSRRSQDLRLSSCAIAAYQLQPNSPKAPVDDEQAPLFGSWSRLYAAVIVYLALLITVFYGFTAAFRVL